MFGKRYEVSLNMVHDTVVIREGDEKLTLTVNADSMRLVGGLSQAQKKMLELKDDTPDEDVKKAAEYFASVIFGKDQARKLFEFYAEDPASVISVCGKYFRERLAAKITKAQKRLKL